MKLELNALRHRLYSLELTSSGSHILGGEIYIYKNQLIGQAVENKVGCPHNVSVDIRWISSVINGPLGVPKEQHDTP